MGEPGLAAKPPPWGVLLSPLAGKHINTLGRYAFASPAGPALRPLRDPADPGNDQ